MIKKVILITLFLVFGYCSTSFSFFNPSNASTQIILYNAAAINTVRIRNEQEKQQAQSDATEQESAKTDTSCDKQDKTFWVILGTLIVSFGGMFVIFRYHHHDHRKYY